MKILVVEDDENSRVYLERALKSQDYMVEGAANGAVALEKALQSPPDMIISDIMMPVMDGFDLCRKVKADERLRHIPFIFYTATFIDKRDEDLAMSLGASLFILKPVEMEELFKIIKQVIEVHKEKKLPVPEKALLGDGKIDEMYSEALARKLEKKVTQLQNEIAQHKRAEEEISKLNTELEQRVKDRTAELDEKNTELERFNRLFVGRELKMIELKTKVADYEVKLGLTEKKE